MKGKNTHDTAKPRFVTIREKIWGENSSGGCRALKGPWVVADR